MIYLYQFSAYVDSCISIIGSITATNEYAARRVASIVYPVLLDTLENFWIIESEVLPC